MQIIDFLAYKKQKQRIFLQADISMPDTTPRDTHYSLSQGKESMPVRARVAAQPITVHDLLVRYAKEYAPRLAETTQRQLKGLYKRIDHDLGATPLTQLTPDQIRLWRDRLATRYAPGTVLRFLDTLSAPLTVAVEDYELLAANPVRKVVKPPVPLGRARCLTPDERDRLLTACQRSRNTLLYLAVLLALATGARKTELLSLRWASVDLTQGMLRFTRTKNGTRRSAPVTGLAFQVLRQHAEQRAVSGLVFPGQGAAPMHVDYPFRIAVKRAGIEDFHFHDLRHTFASYLAMSGASDLEMARLLGHQSMQMVKKYVHFGGAHLISVAAKMTAAFLPEKG